MFIVYKLWASKRSEVIGENEMQTMDEVNEHCRFVAQGIAGLHVEVFTIGNHIKGALMVR